MKLWLFVLLGALCCWGPGAPSLADTPPATAAPAPVPATALSTDDLLRRLEDLTARVNTGERASDIQKQRLDDQEKMINVGLASGSLDTGRLGVLVTFFGVLIAFVVIFFSIRIAETAKAEAIRVAREEIEKTRGDLNALLQSGTETQTRILDYERQATKIAKRLTVLVKISERGTKNINNKSIQATELFNNFQADISDAEKNLVLSTEAYGARKTPPMPPPGLMQAAAEASKRPDTEKSFQDWYLIALAEHDGGVYDKALTACERAEDLAPDPTSRAKVLGIRALSLWFQGEKTKAEDLWQRILNSYDKPDIDDHDLVVVVANTFHNIGAALAEREQWDAAVNVFDRLAARFKDTHAPDIQALLARAQLNKGISLAKTGSLDEAIGVYDDLDVRFKGATELDIIVQVARSLLNKGATLAEAGRLDEAIAAYEDLDTRFRGTTDLRILVQVAKALYNKGCALRDLKQPDGARSTFQDVIDRYGNDADTELRHLASISEINLIAMDNIRD